MMKAVKKYMRVYGLFVRHSIMSMMEYRANFVAGVLVECCFLTLKLMYVFVVFLTGLSINNLSPYYVMLYVGNYTVITGIYNGLFAENLWWLPFNIKTGMLDLLLVKPISIQFYISTKKLSLPMLAANVVTGITMIIIALCNIEFNASVGGVILYFLFLICGVSIAYFLFLLPMLLSFWTIESRGLIAISDKAWDINMMPMHIYGRYIQRLLVFIIPFFAITNFQPLVLIDRLDFRYGVWMILCPLILGFISRVLFRRGVRKYESANG
ncbi:MAG: ABC-2 family transporter protein [Oscillospiraceae bacterium]|jgi:ABC-2 type transport system permease protein|nr:ABC-2 family transporter protein [Oscillospiraceae bacterium]